jgi:hypothetical protein
VFAKKPSAARNRVADNANNELGHSNSSLQVARHTTMHVGEMTIEPATSRIINAPANIVESSLEQRYAKLESECRRLKAALAAAEEKVEGTLHDLENERSRRQKAEEALFAAMESMPATSESNPTEGESNAFPAPLDLSAAEQGAGSVRYPAEGESNAFPALIDLSAVGGNELGVLDLTAALPPPLNLQILLGFTKVQDVQSRRRIGRVNRVNEGLPKGVAIKRNKFSAQPKLKDGRYVHLGCAFDFMEVAHAAVKLAVHYEEYMEKMQRGIESNALKVYVKDELSKLFS